MPYISAVHSFPEYVPRSFDEVRSDLQETVFYLKDTPFSNHKLRYKLLRKLRLLLREADELIESED
jgi:hypothetical protein